MRYRILLLLPLALFSCRGHSTGQTGRIERPDMDIVIPAGKTIEERFLPPPGYERRKQDRNSFGYYLRHLPLKKHGSPVLYYDGREKPNDRVYCGVVAMDIGKKDLQQCADAVMRLRAEYLYSTGQYDKIHFNFTSGFRADYAKWAQGYRIAVSGNNVRWVPMPLTEAKYETFRHYLEAVFSYAGTLSLSRELQSVEYSDLSIGDVLIQGGSPGHAVIVVDVAENRKGEKVYMLAQSYMPAQETQVLIDPQNEDGSPWYTLDISSKEIITPQWKFITSDLKRFGE